MAKEKQFHFGSKNGRTAIHGVEWMPESGECRAVLQIIHGMTEFIERYRPFAEYLTQKGIMVVGHDHLGHGASVNSREEWGYFAEHPSATLVADIHKLRVRMQKEYPGLPYFMLGHSMGSYMLRKYLCIHNENLAGAILMGTGYVPDPILKLGLGLCDVTAKCKGWDYRSKFLQSLMYGKPYRKYDLYGRDYENSWLTKDAEIVKEYYADPRCTFLFTINGYYGLLEAIRYDNQKTNIRKMPKDLPLFLVSGADDPVGDFGKGVKRVCRMYREAGIRDLTCKLYENDRHEILNETDRRQVYVDLYQWMQSRIDGGSRKEAGRDY